MMNEQLKIIINKAEDQKKGGVVKKYVALPRGYYAVYYKKTRCIYCDKKSTDNVIWIIRD